MKHFIILLILILTSFTFSSEITNAQYLNSYENSPEDIDDVFNLASPSIVTVLGERKWSDDESFTMGGSGVLINDDGHLLTAYHVINESTNLRIYNSTIHKRFSLEVIETYPERDLALLKVRDDDIYDYYKPIKVRPFGDMTDMHPGQSVYSLGRFGGDTCFIQTGTLTEIINQPLSDEFYNYIPQVVFDANLYKGFSGGALVDEEGYLLGIISNRDYENHSRNYAIVP
ncbi:MAG TPA: serine protease [Ignavibacteria bacterium]|nr:serine protease [Ignavibacteria bacterium]